MTPKPEDPDTLRVRLDPTTRALLGKLAQTVLTVLAAWLTERILDWMGSGNPGVPDPDDALDA